MKEGTLFLLVFLMLFSSYKSQSQSPCSPYQNKCAYEAFSAPLGLDLSCPQEEYRLVFHDEFDGNTLDLSKWRTKTASSPPFDRTLFHDCERELQYYSDSNFILQNGILEIIAKEEAIVYQGVYQDTVRCGGEIVSLPGEEFTEEFEFSSGRIEAVNSFAVTPQENFIMEIRCKVPKGVGLWPAFWTWHHDEIDVFEYFGTEEGCGIGGSKHFQTAYIHGDRPNCPCPLDFSVPFDLTGSFHTYAIEVNRWQIKWYFDGVVIRTENRFYQIGGGQLPGCGATLPPSIYSRDVTFFSLTEGRFFRPIANLALHQSCSPEEVTGLPAKFEIDYIRVYKRLPSDDEQNLCYYEVEGPESLCYGDEYTFMLNGNVPVNEVDWSTSPNLVIVESEGDQVTVRMSSFSEGDGWIQAKVPGIGFCQDTVFTFNVTTILPFSGVVLNNGIQQPLNFFNFVTDNYPRVILDNVIIERVVRISGSNYASYMPGGNEIFISIPDNGFLQFRVDGVSQECGEVSQEFIFINEGGSSHVLSPNPATTEIKIVTESPERTISYIDVSGNPTTFIVSPLIKGIRVFDIESGAMLIQNDYNLYLSEITINIRNLNPGNYLIEVLGKDGLKYSYSFIKI